ncbi:helix-turn-helix transcriptional regulator [Pseudomonas sp. MTM4]|uniref:helix-turn-helix transcriptional regulator n=1 Tax=unclassified Pseudomonas TaxID=196821 RepID=UPI001039D26F|nr:MULTISPECIES: helix-turn-helix transcriptional regulator [unclassified Pseudomonas]MBC8650848.1 helix-turn-helix transcriptional regulator [Pseudomonas sp. MT4]QXY91195.1 helix-turn-helix transcriptional regulator [Pseudomonas sp. MTM4]TCD21374.1 helix-turn-helix transcriptional regulator [Pseudomonas sp. IC_126]
MLAGAMDVDGYDRLLDKLYAAAVDEPGWNPALTALHELFAANYVTLILRTPNNSDKGLMIVLGDIEGQGSVTYLTYPYDETPFVDTPPNEVFSVSDLMSTSTWRACPYYQRYCAAHDVFHVLGVDISPPGSGTFRFRITRPETAPDFSPAEKALCSRLVPHLSRVLHLNVMLGRNESLRSIYSQVIGRLSIATLVVDASGRIVEQNRIASELLASGDGLKSVGGRLEAYYPGDNQRLYQLLRSALRRSLPGEPEEAEALSISRPSGRVSLGLVVEPVPNGEWADDSDHPALLVYVRDAEGRTLLNNAIARQLFGFTPSETALVIELANGLSLEEAAHSLGIRRNTARAHLRAIFSKTGVRRQTELVRIILNSVVSLGREHIQKSLKHSS